jgi:sigma-E factor negative regulatory protein RseC
VIETAARVIAVEAGYAWVETQRESACCHCATAGSCGVSALGKVLGARADRLRLPNPLAVSAGDEVVIGIPEQRLLAAAFRAYLVPLLCMLGVAVAGAQLGLSSWASGLGSFAALAAGLAGSGAGMCRDNAATQPVMLRRAQSIEVKLAQIARE